MEFSLTGILSSNETAEVYAAIIAMQAELPTVAKNKTAKIPTKKGGEFSYKYADLDSCMSELRPVLAAHGLGIIQGGPTLDAKSVYVETRVIHKSGQWVSHIYSCDPGGRDARNIGAAITYLRRYGLSIVGLTTEDDNDAARPSTRTERKESPKHSPPPATSGLNALAQSISREAKILNDYFRIEKKPFSIAPSAIFEFVLKIRGKTVGKLEDLSGPDGDEVLAWLSAMKKKGDWISIPDWVTERGASPDVNDESVPFPEGEGDQDDQDLPPDGLPF